MFDDLKIRNKLIVLVTGPLVIILLLATLGAQSRRDTAQASERVASLVRIAAVNSDVVDALQVESLTSAAYVGGDRKADPGPLKAARAKADEVLGSAVALLDANKGISPAFRSQAGLALDAADKLNQIRIAVDQGYSWNQAAATYSSLQQTYLAVNDAVGDAITEPQVADELRTAAALAGYKASLADQTALLVGAASAGGFTVKDTFAQFQAADTATSSREAIFTSVADAARKGEVRNALTSEPATVVDAATNAAQASGQDAALSVSGPDVATAAASVLSEVHTVETGLFARLVAQANATQSTAERASTLFLIGALAAILAAGLGAVLLGRRITKPLHDLTTAADQLANEHMPRLVATLQNPDEDSVDFELGSLKDIKVGSRDEIGQLAAAFNGVQRVAGTVAAEQAALLRKGIGEMFVNLARRNQALLDRQIEFIDELERGEEDPDQLENLYRLDHLATRMRRNAESLLVLAGAEPPRRRGRPAPLANVVRAALAEVEDFGRIQLLSFDEVLIASNAAADLAHLLSELMENAANFSPPETRVDVVGQRTSAEHYVISIADHGIGMSADQLAESNQSVAKPPLVGLALSRSLGFIVVGRLARRHGISVRLISSPAGGVTAIVTLPATLITDVPSLDGQAPAMPIAPIAGVDTTMAPAARKQVSAPATLAPVTPLQAVPALASSPASAQSGGLAPLAFAPDEASTRPSVPFEESIAAARPVEEPSPAAPTVSLFGKTPVAVGSVTPTGPVGRAERTPSSSSSSGLPTRTLMASPAPGLTTSVPPPVAFAPPPDEFGTTTESVIDTPPEPDAPVEALAFADPADDSPEPPAPPTPVAEPGSTGPRLDGPPPALAALPARRGPVEAAPFDATARAEAPALLFSSNGSVPVGLDAPEALPTSPAEGGAGLPQRTGSGLTKRTPRGSGAERAIPGADAERNVGATRRSPDEVRSLLARYRDGAQRGRAADPAEAGTTQEFEHHE